MADSHLLRQCIDLAKTCDLNCQCPKNQHDLDPKKSSEYASKPFYPSIDTGKSEIQQNEKDGAARRNSVEIHAALKNTNIYTSKFLELKAAFMKYKKILTPRDLISIISQSKKLLEQTEDAQFSEQTFADFAQNKNNNLNSAIKDIKMTKEVKSFVTYSKTIPQDIEQLKKESEKFIRSLAEYNLQNIQDFKQELLDLFNNASKLMQEELYRAIIEKNKYPDSPDFHTSFEDTASKYGEKMAKKFGIAKERVKIMKDTLAKIEIVQKKDDHDQKLGEILSETRKGQKLLVISDFDGTGADFTKHAKDTRARAAYRRAIETWVEKGHPVSIVTGRSIEGEDGILAALRNSGFSQEIIDKLYIYGSHGAEYRTPNTDGRVEVPENIKPALKLQAKLVDAINNDIQANPILKDLMTKGSIKLEIKRSGDYVSGATFHFRNVVGDKDRESVKEELKSLTSDHIKSHPDYSVFTTKDGVMSFELRLDRNKVTHRIDKGAATIALVEELKPTNVIGLGDDTTDVDIQTEAQELVQKAQLLHQLFIGVQHVDGSDTPKPIMDNSDIVLKGPKNAAMYLLDVANELPSIPTHDQSMT